MIADRISKIELSSTLKIAAKAKAMRAEGIDVVDFSVGEPDFPTPENIREAAKKAIDKDFTKYTATEGIPQLLDAVVEKFERDCGLKYSRSEIIVSAGGKHCLYNLALSLFEEGEEVIIPAPYWVSYPAQVRLAGAKPVFVHTREENGFKLTPAELKAAIDFNTKALILNSPCNPTGAAYTAEELAALAEVALAEGIYVIADEIYEKIVYDGFKFTCFASLGEEVKKRTIVVNGVSKAYSMTGWRIGFAAGPKELIQAMVKVQSHSTSNATSISQMAALEALKGPQYEIPRMVAEFQRRRNYIMNRLGRIEGVSCKVPEGAFYVFPNFSHYYNRSFEGMVIRNSYGLSYYLLKEARVALVPGDSFGADECIRISYATSMEQIVKGMDRIEEAVRKLHPTRVAIMATASNVVTEVKKETPVECEVTAAVREELVEEARKYLAHDQYYEWNANINGIIVQLRTNGSHLYDFWMENWYPAQLETDLEPHGIIYAVTGIPGRDPHAYYHSETRTGVVFNSSYYGQCRSLALGIAADIAEKQFGVHLVRGTCLDVAGNGVVLLSTSGAGRPGVTYNMLQLQEARVHSDDCLFIRYRGAAAVADISERKFYVRTNLVKKFPNLAKLFYRSKCENVVMNRQECRDSACTLGADCPLDLGEPYCFWASKHSRALLDPYWIGGAEKYVKRVPVRYLFLLTKDPVSPAIQELGREDALKVLQEGQALNVPAGGEGASEKQPFFNPYLLGIDEERVDLQTRFFTKLLQVASCYLVNTGAEGEREILSRIRFVLLGR